MAFLVPPADDFTPTSFDFLSFSILHTLNHIYEYIFVLQSRLEDFIFPRLISKLNLSKLSFLKYLLVGSTLSSLFNHGDSSSRNSGIHLAVGPVCGKLSGSTADVNAGIPPMVAFETVVSFGDSFTDGGRHDGGPLAPPVLDPPGVLAGGRSTNGKTWIEDLVDYGHNITLMDYAVSGAVTNVSLWPSAQARNANDFITQVSLFLSQDNKLNSATTLYTIFFGINDYVASLTDGDRLPEAAQAVLNEITLLASPPTNARFFLVTDVYGRSTSTPSGDAYKQSIFTGLHAMHTHYPFLHVAFADFARIWDGVLGPDPGYEAFGYTSDGYCVDGGTTEDACSDPEHTFYWIPDHPSKETMQIMAEYVVDVINECQIF